MGLLPMEADILPPSEDRVFKLILTSEDAKPVLIDLISSIIKRPVVGVEVRNSEVPLEDTHEKAERLDVNCRIDDGSQVDLEMQASRIEEESDGKHQNLKGKSIYYLCDLHSSQPSKGVRRYDKRPGRIRSHSAPIRCSTAGRSMSIPFPCGMTRTMNCCRTPFTSCM